MLHLSQHLADRGIDVHVLTTTGNIADAKFRFQVHPIMRTWSWSELPKLIKFVKGCTPDAVLLNYMGFFYNYHPMITFAPTIVKKMFPGVPFVTQVVQPTGAITKCTLLGRVVRKGMKWLVRRKGVDWNYGTLLRDSDRVIVLCEGHRATLAGLCPSFDEKYVLVPPPPILHITPDDNGASRRRGRELLSLKTNEFLLMFFGRIYPGKGVETLLRAFQIVSTLKSNVRLAVVGGTVTMDFPSRPCYGKEVSELARELGIDDKVSWTGEYSWDSDVGSAYLRAADVCVLPFDQGVQLNNSSFASAAAHGLPIITTKGDMLEKSFVHQENVFLCLPRNPEALAAAIVRLMDHPELRQRLAVGALQLAREWFSWEGAVDRTLETLS